MQKISIIQAMAEKDRLVKSIYDVVNEGRFVDLSIAEDQQLWISCLEKEQFRSQADGSYERFIQLRDEYLALNLKVIHTYGTSRIQTSQGSMSAIAVQQMLSQLLGDSEYEEDGDFTAVIGSKMKADYEFCIREVRERRTVGIRGREARLEDPLDVRTLLSRLEKEKQDLIVELETALQTWRATTYIEIG